MRMQYGQWLLSTGISLVATVALAAPALAGTMAEGQAAGASAGVTVKGLFGSKDGFNANISKPLTNTDTPLRTVDGSTAFSANIAMPSTSRFLELLIQPGATGDLQVATFSTDLDMDGAFDYVFQVPRPVSGVCGNGYVSCAPGTWSNCTAYKWTADQNGHLSDMAVPVTELGGCYCINSSCGSSLVWNNAGIVLKDLAGGAVAAIQKANTGFMVTNVSATPVSISYYGRLTNTAEMSTTNSTMLLPPPAEAQNYYKSPENLSGTVNNLVTASNSDPNSLYSLLASSQAAKTSQNSVHTCDITRIGQPKTITEDIGYDVSFFVGYDSNGSNKECFWATETYQCKDIFESELGWAHCKTTAQSMISTIVKGLIPSVANVSCVGMEIKSNTDPVSPHPGCYGSGDNATHQFLHVWCYTQLPHEGAEIFTDLPLLREKRDEYTESVIDGCSSLAEDPLCSLQGEEIDSVQTYHNFNSTGLAPLATCRTFQGQLGPFQICRPWWTKQRTYMCESKTPWDFSAIGKRFGSVQTSIQQNGASITFNDSTQGDDGTWTNKDGISMTMISMPAGESCEKACKTKVPKEDNEVTVTSLGSVLRANNSNAFDFLYKLCVNNVCPVDQPGEEIISDCQCGSSFVEAATAIQAMRLAGKDTICTSGTPKPLQ